MFIENVRNVENSFLSEIVPGKNFCSAVTPKVGISYGGGVGLEVKENIRENIVENII